MRVRMDPKIEKTERVPKMQSTTRQIEFTEQQLAYIKDHWNISSVEKIRRTTALSDRQIWYAAYAILKLGPKPNITRGRGRYTTLQDIKALRLTGESGNLTGRYIRIPSFVSKYLGFDMKGDSVPVAIVETTRTVTVTLFKKGHSP